MWNLETDCYLACRLRNTKHPRYRQCDLCQHRDYCDIKNNSPPPEPPKRRVSWFVDHALLSEGENFSLIKILRRLASILSR